MKQPVKWVTILAGALLALAAVSAGATGAQAGPGGPSRRQAFVVPAACDEMEAGSVAWVTLDEDGDIDQQVESYDSGVTTITPVFEYDCVPRAVTIVSVFTLNGETIFTDRESLRATNGGGRYAYPLGTNDDAPMDDGEWGVRFYNNRTLLSQGYVLIGESGATAGETATVEGTVIDQRNKKPIRGAVVLVLEPGITVTNWVEEGQLKEDVYSAGKSDSKGVFQLANPLQRNVAYSIVIVARGFKPLGKDGLLITNQQPDPVQLDIKMRQ